MTADQRVVPEPDGPAVDFYRYAAAGDLRLQRCAECGRVRHPPRWLCPACRSDRVEWAPTAGRGRLVAWTVTHRPVDPGWADRLPVATVVVELDEGVRLVGATELGADELEMGLAMVATLEPVGESFAFLWFGTDR